MNQLVYIFDTPAGAARFIAEVNVSEFDSTQQLRAKLDSDSYSVQVNYRFRAKSSQVGNFDPTPSTLDRIAEPLGGREKD